MRGGIKEKDIRDFEKCSRKLNEIICRIVEYQPNARIYVTPGTINLMQGWPEYLGVSPDEAVISDVSCDYIDMGDW